MQLTLQIYQNSTWQDAAELILEQPKKGRRSHVELTYLQDYALDWFCVSAIGDVHACSVHFPVDCIAPYRQTNQWFGFMDDIVPSGAALRYWVRHFGLDGLSEGEQDLALFSRQEN